MNEDDDRTVVVPQSQDDDRTVAVPAPAPAPTPEREDLTVVVAREAGAAAEGRTVVVPAREAEDRTVLAPRNPAARRRTREEGADTVSTFSGTPAPPVEEPRIEPSPELAALMFKKPLDPKRTVPDSPFPRSEQALPQRGVRPGMPVLYSVRTEHTNAHDAELAEAVVRRLGAPPESAPVPVAQRDGLPSMARANRRFRAVALGGSAAALAVSVAGLWWVWSVAFG